MTTISLFSGIGGNSYGFEQAGISVIWANDIDKDACATYRNNFSSPLIEGDIANIPSKEIPNCDILNAGFPCQAFSIAGLRKGFEDTRGTLFFDIARILRDKKPRAVFLENVKNLENHDKGRTFSVILSILRELGYKVKYKVINSADFGIPQNRERIYIIGFLDESAFERFDFPSGIPLTKRITDIINPSEKKEEKYYYTSSSFVHYDKLLEVMKNADTVYQWRRVYCRENKSNLCPTLTANMGTGGHNVPLVIDNFGFRKLTPEECIKFQGFPEEFIFPNISNSSKYKQAGNSVTVPVVKEIANKMREALS